MTSDGLSADPVRSESSRMPVTRVATTALLAVTFIWGTTFVVVQDAIETMPVSSFLLWRFAMAAVLLMIVRPRAVVDLPAPLRRRGAVAGLVLGVGYVLQTVGLAHTSAAVSGFVTGMFVVFTPLVSALVTRRRVSGTTWLAVGIATVGLGFLALDGWSLGFGEALTLLSAFVYAVHIVMLGMWSSREHAYGLTVVQLGAVAVLSAVLTIPDGGPVMPPDASTWVALVFLAVLATAVAFGVQTWAQAHLSPTRTAIVMTTEPVWAGLIGVVVAGDPFTVRFAVGASLVLVAMYLVELAPRRPGEPAPPDPAALPHLEP